MHLSLHICCANSARHFNRCLLKHSPRESKQCHLGEAATTQPSAAQLQLSRAQPSVRALPAPPALPSAQPFEGSDAKSRILTQVLTKGPIPQENLVALMTFWSLLCQDSELPGHPEVTCCQSRQINGCSQAQIKIYNRYLQCLWFHTSVFPCYKHCY